MAHRLVSGLKTTPKNSFLFNSLKEQLKNCIEGNVGFTFFDTTGIVSNHLLYTAQQLYRGNLDKVHYVRIGETQYPCGLNVLSKISPDNLSYIINDTVKMSDRAQSILVKTLTEIRGREGKTLLDVTMQLKLSNLFAKVITDISSDAKEFVSEHKSDIQAGQYATLEVENVIQKITGGTLKLHLGQRDFELPIDKFIRNGHSVIFDLSGLDPLEQKFVMNTLSLVYLQIGDTFAGRMASKHMIAYEDSDFLNTKLISWMVQESRRFGFDVTLSTDSVCNYPENVQNVLSQNVDTFVVFNHGSSSVRALHKFIDFLPMNELLPLGANTAKKIDRETHHTETVNIESITFKSLERETLDWLESREGIPRQVVHNEIVAYMAIGEWE